MVAVFFGLILVVLSFILKRVHTMSEKPIDLKPWAWVARIAGLVFIVGGTIVATIVIVPAGYRGVKLQFGAVSGVMSEGIHMIIPYINTYQNMEVRTQKEESDANASSKDLQNVTTKIALNFHVSPDQVGNLYKSVGMDYIHRIIDPAVQESIKTVTAQYTAEELIKHRALVKTAVEDEITKRLLAYNLIVEPLGLSITNFEFSSDFNNAIEAKQVAQQEAEKQKYILQKAELQRQTAITTAKGVSEAAKLNAASLQAQGGSKVLAREWIEKWDGHVPTVSSGGGGVIIDINSLLQKK